MLRIKAATWCCWSENCELCTRVGASASSSCSWWCMDDSPPPIRVNSFRSYGSGIIASLHWESLLIFLLVVWPRPKVNSFTSWTLLALISKSFKQFVLSSTSRTGVLVGARADSLNKFFAECLKYLLRYAAPLYFFFWRRSRSCNFVLMPPLWIFWPIAPLTKLGWLSLIFCEGFGGMDNLVSNWCWCWPNTVLLL